MSNIGKNYRKMLSQLDDIGYMIAVDRVSKHQFSFLVNGVLEKTYRKRDSCNRRLKKIYHSHYLDLPKEPTK